MLNTSLQRLSSGLRINSAKDDAAGLAISERFTSQIRGLNQAARNANDGISLAQTGEGALAEVTNNLQRIRELSVQSANATNSASDRAALQQEVSQLVAEIDRVATQTNFNGVNLLDGTFASQTFQVGANVGETIDVSGLASARTSSLGQYAGFTLTNQSIGTASDTPAAQTVDVDGTTYSLGTIANDAKALADAINASGVQGLTASADVNSVAGTTSAITGSAADADVITINGLDISVTNSANAATNRTLAVEAINAQSAVTGVIAADDGTGVALTAADGRNITVGFTAGAAATAADYGLATATTGATIDVSYVAPTGVTGDVTFGGAFAPGAQTIASTGTAMSAVDISTVSGSEAAITAVDAALNAVNSSRATLGAIQNRFESVITSVNTTSENLSASRSRIMDADFAAETANLTKAQILQQAGTAMLAQANSLPGNVLSLLG
jgi:flagellin